MMIKRPAWLAALAILIPLTAGAEDAVMSVDLSRPLSADDCVRIALQRNYQVRLAEDQLKSANASKLGAYGSFFPSLNTGYDYSHSKSTYEQKPGSTFSPFPNISDGNSFSINASQTLLSLPAIFGIVAARKASGAARSDMIDAESQVAMLVRQQYFTVIESIKLEDVAREDRKLADEELKRTQSLFDVGSVARTDVLKSNVRVAEAQSTLTAAANRTQLERARLALYLALPPGTLVQVLDTLDPRGEAPDSVGAYRQALDTRPDLKAARLRLDAAGVDRKSALARKLPYLSHSFNRNHSLSRGDDRTFTVTSTGLGQDTTFVRTTSTSWNYRIGLSWNILDGLVTASSVQRASAQELSARHSLENLELQVQLDVTDALVAMRNAAAQVQTAREALTSAQEDLKLSQERYSVGLGTILELIDAQVKLTRARTGEVQAMAALKRAEALYDRAIGRVNW